MSDSIYKDIKLTPEEEEKLISILPPKPKRPEYRMNGKVRKPETPLGAATYHALTQGLLAGFSLGTANYFYNAHNLADFAPNFRWSQVARYVWKYYKTPFKYSVALSFAYFGLDKFIEKNVNKHYESKTWRQHFIVGASTGALIGAMKKTNNRAGSMCSWALGLGLLNSGIRSNIYPHRNYSTYIVNAVDPDLKAITEPRRTAMKIHPGWLKDLDLEKRSIQTAFYEDRKDLPPDFVPKVPHYKEA